MSLRTILLYHSAEMTLLNYPQQNVGKFQLQKRSNMLYLYGLTLSMNFLVVSGDE